MAFHELEEGDEEFLEECPVCGKGYMVPEFGGWYQCSECGVEAQDKDETRYLLDNIKVWGTTNSIEITASGIVKVGYDMNDIVVKVDDDRIYIKLPEAQLNDNYVIWDTVTCSESNNILNPIEFSQYQEIVDEIEEMGLADVESEGIYQNASENVKKIMNGFLSEFKDYEIVYM